MPVYPLRPGDYTAPDSWFQVFTQQPVRSLIVRPPRCSVARDRRVRFEGKAWSGAGDVSRVELSHDHGATWLPVTLAPPANKWAWQRWEANVTLPSLGHWEVFVRATDHTGAAQPMLVPGWNPGGYGNNQAMKIDIQVLPPVVLPGEPRAAGLPQPVAGVEGERAAAQLLVGDEPRHAFAEPAAGADGESAALGLLGDDQRRIGASPRLMLLAACVVVALAAGLRVLGGYGLSPEGGSGAGYVSLH